MSDPRITKLRDAGVAGPEFAVERNFLREPFMPDPAPWQAPPRLIRTA